MEIDKLKAVSHPFRKHVIERLAIDGVLTTLELKGEFDMTKAAVSQHIKVLRDCQLITETKTGRNKHYSIDPRGIKEVFDWAESFQAFWSGKMHNLNSYLEDQHGKN